MVNLSGQTILRAPNDLFHHEEREEHEGKSRGTKRLTPSFHLALLKLISHPILYLDGIQFEDHARCALPVHEPFFSFFPLHLIFPQNNLCF